MKEVFRMWSIAVNLRTVLEQLLLKFGIKTYYPNWNSISFFLIIFDFLCEKGGRFFLSIMTAF